MLLFDMDYGIRDERFNLEMRLQRYTYTVVNNPSAQNGARTLGVYSRLNCQLRLTACMILHLNQLSTENLSTQGT
jgi:hypothetical protein